MKTSVLFLGLFLFNASSFGQSTQSRNLDLIKIADSLYGAEDYKGSAFAFSEAFKANGWNATSNQHYNAACSWALANYPDSAFYHLNYIATKMNYTDYGHIKGDPDFKSLYHDARWQTIIELVKTNKDIAYSNIDFITVNGLEN